MVLPALRPLPAMTRQALDGTGVTIATQWARLNVKPSRKWRDQRAQFCGTYRPCSLIYGTIVSCTHGKRPTILCSSVLRCSKTVQVHVTADLSRGYHKNSGQALRNGTPWRESATVGKGLWCLT